MKKHFGDGKIGEKRNFWTQIKMHLPQIVRVVRKSDGLREDQQKILWEAVTAFRIGGLVFWLIYLFGFFAFFVYYDGLLLRLVIPSLIWGLGWALALTISSRLLSIAITVIEPKFENKRKEKTRQRCLLILGGILSGWLLVLANSHLPIVGPLLIAALVTIFGWIATPVLFAKVVEKETTHYFTDYLF